ncbi:MAG: Holliday junction branch migration protein RuvA [Holosporales bacterium]|jgi:Holliday junction DNA helicase RuvA|nr:Holliday junction branch migration protein RuvA [Holosporales bacterium]
MIARLTGKIDFILEDSIIIDANGIGFQVFIATKLKDSFSIGQEISLRIFHVFRQEQQYLCGFSNEEELNIFKALLDVPGIGVKSAISVLSTLSVEEFAVAVANQDPETLCRVGGVGRKTAERILLELKDKTITKIKDIYFKENQNINDAILGLISLGYQKNMVIKLISEISKTLGQTASTNEIIVQCLKNINS